MSHHIKHVERKETKCKIQNAKHALHSHWSNANNIQTRLKLCGAKISLSHRIRRNPNSNTFHVQIYAREEEKSDEKCEKEIDGTKKKTQPKASHALTLLAWLGMEIYLIRYTNENGLASYAIVYCKMIALRVRSVVWTDIWCYMHAIGLGEKMIDCVCSASICSIRAWRLGACCLHSLALSFFPSFLVCLCMHKRFFFHHVAFYLIPMI